MRVGAALVTGSLLAAGVATSGEQRMVSVGDRGLSVYCDGERSGWPTVILLAGGGRTAEDWSRVQPEVAEFTRVCSYDYANHGRTDAAPVPLQSVDQVVADLHGWLDASGEEAPFVLVSHSIAGFYARAFTASDPTEVAGLVFVDSSHEEQALRLKELDPDGAELNDLTATLGFFTEPDRRLEWRTELPLIALARGKPFPRKARDGSDSPDNRMTEEQFAAWDRTWRGFQADLAARSPRGELRVAQESGHFIHHDESDLVVRAIRDVCRTQ